MRSLWAMFYMSRVDRNTVRTKKSVMKKCITYTYFLMLVISLSSVVCNGQDAAIYENQILEQGLHSRIESVRLSRRPRFIKRIIINKKIDSLLVINSKKINSTTDLIYLSDLYSIKGSFLRLRGRLKDSYEAYFTILEHLRDDKVKFQDHLDKYAYHQMKNHVIRALLRVHMEMEGEFSLASRKLFFKRKSPPVHVTCGNDLDFAERNRRREECSFIIKNYDDDFLLEYLESFYQPFNSSRTFDPENRIIQDTLIAYIKSNYDRSRITAELERLSNELLYMEIPARYTNFVPFSFLNIDVSLRVFKRQSIEEEAWRNGQNIYFIFEQTYFYKTLMASTLDN